MRYLNLIPIALVAAVSGVLSGDAVGQRGTAAPPQAIGSPLAPGTFPYRDAVNAGTVSIITAPAGGAKSVFAADMACRLREISRMRIADCTLFRFRTTKGCGICSSRQVSAETNTRI